MPYVAHPSSFRDPDGFLFISEGKLFRAVAHSYEGDYAQLMSSGLYEALLDRGWIVPHHEVSYPLPTGYSRALLPELLPCINYPYEWSFGQFQDAALLTLNIQLLALTYGMMLKDASAFNIIWHHGRPVFIDTLSFTRRSSAAPWIGYRQFCNHFLAPLALMHYTDLRLQKLFQTYLDGIPLDLCSRLLPRSTWLKPGLLIHVHLHARLQKRHSGARKRLNVQVSDKALANLTRDLYGTIGALKLPSASTEWSDYYTFTNYTPEQFARKKSIISDWVIRIKPATVCDLGANDGTFSRIAADTSELVIAADIDPKAVHANYLRCKEERLTRVLPMLVDLTAPSPSLGWDLRERLSLFDRLRSELGMALALVHHLAIGNNTSLDKIMQLFARIAPQWIVEFVGKADSQAQRMLSNREDIFPDYNEQGFESALAPYFKVHEKCSIDGTHRTLYLLSARKKQ